MNGENYQGNIAKLYEKYRIKIFHHVYNDFLKSKDLRWDVVNEVFHIFMKRNENFDDIPRLNRKFRGTLRYLIAEAVREVTRLQKIEISKIEESNIKNFYDKVKLLVEKGYHEDEARELVVLEESLNRHRIVEKSGSDMEALNNPKDAFRAEFAKIQAECFEELRNDPRPSEFYDILVDRHFLGLTYNEIIEKYDSTISKARTIITNGLKIIKECIKKKFGDDLREEFI